MNHQLNLQKENTISNSVLKLKSFLDQKVSLFNTLDFIENDPISVPHAFSKKQDIEIAGFFAAILSWGNRKTILKNCRFLMTCMDNAPYDFVENYKESDLRPMAHFVHRTFNTTDLFYILHFLKKHYQQSDTLETAFTQFMHLKSPKIEDLLTGFHQYVFDDEWFPERTRKHIATPEKNSACKRLNMFLRWMVRKDISGVDFGIWNKIKPAMLICPLDVHSGRTARNLGLLTRKQNDWKAAEELTENLRLLNPEDPVIYDFALFGLGVSGENNFRVKENGRLPGR